MKIIYNSWILTRNQQPATYPSHSINYFIKYIQFKALPIDHYIKPNYRN